jgi:hypothetical protein
VPGQYQAVVQPPVQGVYVKSIQFGSHEVPSGRITLASVAPWNYQVYAFPNGYVNWMRSPEFRKRLKDRDVPVTVQECGGSYITQTDGNERFAIANVVPGSYLATASKGGSTLPWERRRNRSR